MFFRQYAQYTPPSSPPFPQDISLTLSPQKCYTGSSILDNTTNSKGAVMRYPWMDFGTFSAIRSSHPRSGSAGIVSGSEKMNFTLLWIGIMRLCCTLVEKEGLLPSFLVFHLSKSTLRTSPGVGPWHITKVLRDQGPTTRTPISGYAASSQPGARSKSISRSAIQHTLPRDQRSAPRVPKGIWKTPRKSRAKTSVGSSERRSMGLVLDRYAGFPGLFLSHHRDSRRRHHLLLNR